MLILEDLVGLQRTVQLQLFQHYCPGSQARRHKEEWQQCLQKLINLQDLRFSIHEVSKDGEALYSQQKQDQELTVAQTMNSLLPNSDLN